MSYSEKILNQTPGNFLEKLRGANQAWQSLKEGNKQWNPVVKVSQELLNHLDFDIVISGGTLGILLATALQKLGWRVALIEKGILRGRSQEWNISRDELTVFLELELLNPTELEEAIATEYEFGRISFFKGYELWVKDVLNLGIDPVYLLETLKIKFLDFGGKLLEKTPFTEAMVHPDGVLVKAGETTLKTRLLIDAMGNFSPIVAMARKNEQPDGVCLVVGSCAKGYTVNNTGDLIVSFTPIQNQCQYFWEAFPARDGRTTYMFTYLDVDQKRPSLEFFMDEYLRLLPEYQNIELSQLQFERFLFGFFPAYRKSPLKMPWNRILAIGDSSGGQSPVSFGGFGYMVRHLQRLTFGIDEAMKLDFLEANALSLLQPYQPNISVTWLFQKTMSVKVDGDIPPNQINDLMSGVFKVMDSQGDEVLKPFLKDVIRFIPLTKTLPLVNPLLVLPFLAELGIPIFIDWFIHYLNLGLYSGLYPMRKLVQPITKNLSPTQQYYFHRWFDAWKYGSGFDSHSVSNSTESND